MNRSERAVEGGNMVHVSYVELLPSGYWHVRFGMNRFAQWPKWERCMSDDVFCGCGENLELAQEAEAVVAELQEGKEC